MTKNLGFQETDPRAAFHHRTNGRQFGCSHGSHKIDTNVDGTKSLILIQRAAECDAHRGIGQQRQDTAMDRSHGVMMTLVDRKADLGLAQYLMRLDDHPNEIADRRVIVTRQTGIGVRHLVRFRILENIRRDIQTQFRCFANGWIIVHQVSSNDPFGLGRR